MRALLLLIALIFAAPVFGQSGRPGVILETVADAMARKAREGEEISIRHHSANILWSAPRAFTAFLRSAVTNDHDGVHYITNSRPDAASVYVSQDRFDPTQMAEWFGIMGDDGQDDAAPLRSAIQYFPARSATWDGTTNAISTRLVLPKGNLDFASTVLIDRPLNIGGQSREATVIHVSGTNTAFNVNIPYVAGQYAYVYLHDLSLAKSLDNRTGVGVFQDPTGSQIIAERINIVGFATGIKLLGWASSFRDITIQEAGENGVHVPSSVPYGFNPTSTQFERVLIKNGVGNGFNIENSSYFSFVSCYTEKHTNGIGWRIVSTSDRGVAGANYAIQMQNCASEFDFIALRAERTSSLTWDGGMFLPASNTTNVVQFVGPVKAVLRSIEVPLPYTPTQAGYTVWTEDSGYGWPYDVQIVGGQWRRLTYGIENRPGTVVWRDQFTTPDFSPWLPFDAPGYELQAATGAVSVDMTGHTIGTNAFTLFLDTTWPAYNAAASETVAHTSTGAGWDNANVMFVALFNDAKFGLGSYNPDSANSLSARATNALAAFSGRRTRTLISRDSDGLRMWVAGKRIPLEITTTGSGGSFATNAFSGPWLHFGSMLTSNRFKYHSGGVLNYAVASDEDALEITKRGPEILPWASFGSSTPGNVFLWRVNNAGDYRDSGPLKLPVHIGGTPRFTTAPDDLWTTYGRREFITTNATSSSQFRQTYGTVLPGYAEVFNAYGGLLLVDSTNNLTQKTGRLGIPNFASSNTIPMGLIGGLSYTNGGDVNFGGYGSSLFSKASQYLWAYGSAHDDTTGWLGMYSSRGNGLHLLNPATVRWGTNLTSGQHSSISHVEPGRMIQVAPIQFEFWADSGDREVAINTNGMVIESGKSLTLGGVTRTNWPSGFAFSDLTNALVMGANMSAVYTSTNMTISSSGGGGGATNGTAITVDSGAFLSTANFADSSRVGFSISGTNITADIVSGSVRTNELDAAALSYLTAWTSLSGVPSFVSDLAGATGSAGTLLYFDGTFLQELALGTSGQVLTVSGSAPAWADPTGGGGSTNGTPVSVDGSLLAAANFSDGSRIGFSASGTNVTADIVAASVRTNELAAAAISYLTAWSSLSGTPTSLSGYGITDAQPLDTDLTRIANVAWASGDFVYRDATGLTNFASTSVGRGLLNAADEVDQLTLLTLIGGTPTDIDSNARVLVRKNSGTDVGTRRRLNFIEGANTTLTIADDAGNEEVDITIASTGGGSSVSVDGTAITGPNWISSADITNVITGVTNIAPTVRTASVTTNKIDSTFRTWVESMASGGGGTGGLFTSAITNIPVVESVVSFTHGLGAAPKIVQAWLKANDSDADYVAGDIIPLETTFQWTTADLVEVPSPLWGVTADSSAVFVSRRAGGGSGGLRVYAKDDGRQVELTEAKWDLFVVAAVNFGGTGGTTNLVSMSAAGLAPQATLPNAVLGTDGSTNVAWTVAPVRTKTLASFRAQQGEPPASNYGRLSTRNAIGTALFDHTTSQALRFRWVVPEGYTNTVADVVLKWTTSATSGDGRWGARNMGLTGDVDADSFGTAVEATTTTSGTAGTVMTTTLEDVGLDGAVAGDWVWAEVYRDSGDAADTINSNDLELHAVEVRAP